MAMLALGVLMVMLSMLLAVTIHFRHFYELLVLGQFIAMYGLPSTRLCRRLYAPLYLILAGAGVIADLIMGRYIGRFWHYNHFGLADYLILYAFTYPVAGIVMVQSFWVVRALLLLIRERPDWSRALSVPQYIAVIIYLTVALLAVFAEGLIAGSQNLLALAYVLAVLLAFLVISFVTTLNNHRTVVDDARSQPLGMLAAVSAATYFNAFLHEIPNTFAHEWTYTNFPLPALSIFGIPVIALLGWPLLLLFPLSIHYWLSPAFLRGSLPAKTTKDRG